METHAKPVEKAEFDAFDHINRYFAALRFDCKSCKVARGIGQK